MVKNLKKKKGFTLIELIIVIAILGILAAIAIPKFSDVQSSSKKKADIASAKTIADTAAMLIADEKIKPATETGAKIVVKGTEASNEIGIKVGNALQNVPNVQATSGVFVINITSTGIITVYVAADATVAISNDNQIYPKPTTVGSSNPFYN